MDKLILKSLFIFIFFMNGNSQINFQKTYLFQDTFCVISNIYSTDSCYFFTAYSGKQPQRSDLVFGKMALDGTIIHSNKIETPNFEFSGSLSEIDTTMDGNLVFSYFPHVYTFSKNGNLISTINLLNFFQDTTYVSENKMIVNHNDGTYLFLLNYSEHNTDNNPPGPNFRNGVCLVNFSPNGDTLWTKRFYSAQSNAGSSSFNALNLVKDINSGYVFTVSDRKVFGWDSNSNNSANLHVYRVDSIGNLSQHFIIGSCPNCVGTNSLNRLENGEYMYSYLKSKLVTTSSGQEFKYQPHIAVIDSNFQLLENFPLNNEWLNDVYYNTSPKELIFLNKDTYVGSYTWVETFWYDSTVWNTKRIDVAVKLIKRRIPGEELWSREFHFFPLIDSLSVPDYSLNDLEITTDGGLIICGETQNYDSLNANVPYQYGYVLKTNCYGFVGGPQANCNYKILSEFNVDFYNTSNQAGIYEWHFGDNTVLWTDEFTDSITHTYPHFGPFEVLLIAHGCNGETDTLKFSVNPVYHLNPSLVTNGNNYLTIFPNPLPSGSYLFIYINGIDMSKGSVKIKIYNNEGKLVDTFPVTNTEGSYIIENNYSAGKYDVVLLQDESLIESEKLVVIK